jgi:outer membrane protein assembly factor BamD
MYRKLINLSLILFFVLSCSKDEVKLNIPVEKERSIEVYMEAVNAMSEGDYFFASKKFLEAENILPTIEYSAKASLMASYCFYVINFYEESMLNLEKFIVTYPANKNIPYANYLIVVSIYEQILDEKKDVAPLLMAREKINIFLEKFPNTEYALDLKFKLDLVNNQLAAKELYVAKYYIKSQKWIPAINRLKVIVNKYSETIFIEEALHRLVEIYYKIGLEEEAKSAAILLGYNYNSSAWYEKSYKILNKDYKIPKLKNSKENIKKHGLITRTIKKITKW